MPTPSDVLEAEVASISEQLDKAVSVHLSCLEALSAAQAAVDELRGQQVRAQAALDAWNGVITKPVAEEPAPAKPKKPKDRNQTPDNPYANIQCKGCGKLGSVREVLKTTESGKTYRALSCRSCNHVQL